LQCPPLSFVRTSIVPLVVVLVPHLHPSIFNNDPSQRLPIPHLNTLHSKDEGDEILCYFYTSKLHTRLYTPRVLLIESTRTTRLPETAICPFESIRELEYCPWIVSRFCVINCLYISHNATLDTRLAGGPCSIVFSILPLHCTSRQTYFDALYAGYRPGKTLTFSPHLSSSKRSRLHLIYLSTVDTTTSRCRQRSHTNIVTKETGETAEQV
jgi:hypothetical protein